MLEITKEFRFDAAHFLPTAPEGHPYRRLHGHSFRVIVGLQGPSDPQKRWMMDLGEVEAAVTGVRNRLDHYCLNDIEGLEVPTLEELAVWIFDRLAPDLPLLAWVKLIRDSAGESCTYRP
jgi:6-pyruvoyltetrahydropterin/6-carboxytetrahydropterin synthase